MMKTKLLSHLARLLVLYCCCFSMSFAFDEVLTANDNTSLDTPATGDNTSPSGLITRPSTQYQLSLFSSGPDMANNTGEIPASASGTIPLILMMLGMLLLSFRYWWRINILNSQTQRLTQLVEERSKALALANLKLEKLSCVDLMTNTCNRRDFITQAEKEFERFYRYHQNFSVIKIEIDNYHCFNERYGFDCGDYVLLEVARSLKAYLRCGDVLARWGTKEFIILLPATLMEGGEIAAEKIKQQVLSGNFSYKNTSLPVTISAGAVQIELGESLDTCVQRADKALTLACKQGGNQVVTISAMVQVKSRKKISL